MSEIDDKLLSTWIPTNYADRIDRKRDIDFIYEWFKEAPGVYTQNI